MTDKKLRSYRATIKVGSLTVELSVKATSLLDAATEATKVLNDNISAEPRLHSITDQSYCND
jgi:hypothetical protein